MAREKLKHGQDSAEGRFLSEAVPFFQEDAESPNHIRLPYFVACFSEARDDLAQWRAYGNGENGYALAFKTKDLRGVPNSIVSRVMYPRPETFEELAGRVADQTVSFFREGLEKFPEIPLNDWIATFLATWDQILTQVAPMIKDPGFEGERELRIIKSYSLSDLQDLKFVQKPSMLSRHLPIKPSPTRTDPYRLPIHEVMIGPSRYPHVSRISVGTLLQQRGYTCMVSNSKIPYQST